MESSDRIAAMTRSKKEAIQKRRSIQEAATVVENWEEMTIIPRRKSEEETDLTEAQSVLKRVKDSLGAGRVLLLFYDIPARS